MRDPLADLLHELRVGCDMVPRDRADIGMGYEHSGTHEEDAANLRRTLAEVPSDEIASELGSETAR